VYLCTQTMLNNAPAQGHFAPFGLTIRSRQISNMVPW